MRRSVRRCNDTTLCSPDSCTTTRCPYRNRSYGEGGYASARSGEAIRSACACAFPYTTAFALSGVPLLPAAEDSGALMLREARRYSAGCRGSFCRMRLRQLVVQRSEVALERKAKRLATAKESHNRKRKHAQKRNDCDPPWIVKPHLLPLRRMLIMPTMPSAAPMMWL